MTKTDTGQWVWVPRRIPDDILKEVGPMEGFEAGHPKADDCHRKWWSDVISAIPPRQWTDEEVERAANAVYDGWISDIQGLEGPWEHLLPYYRERLRDAMRAALSTLGGVGT